MFRFTRAAMVVMPVLFMATPPASGTELCDSLAARRNQLPEIIGSSTAVHYKAETDFQLRQMETSIRRDLRQLRCPSASIVVWGAANTQDCMRLGAELNAVLNQQQSVAELQPVLSQTVDDGSGLLQAIDRQMAKAACSTSSIGGSIEIISTRKADIRPAFAVMQGSTEPENGTLQTERDLTSSEQDREDLSAIFQNGGESDYGTPQSFDMPDDYGMIELTPKDVGESHENSLLEVPAIAPSETPSMSSSITSPNAADTEISRSAPEIPVRDYNPNDGKVRRIGPAFLAEKEDGIDLHNPANPASPTPKFN